MEQEEAIAIAHKLYDEGKVDEAIASLDTNLELENPVESAKGLAITYQQNTGKLDDAISIMKHCVTESMKKEDAYLTKYRLSLVELCSALAELLQEQAEGGSGYARKRNKVMYGPTKTKNDTEEDAWKKERFLDALGYLKRAVKLLEADDPEYEAELKQRIGRLLKALGDNEATLKFYLSAVEDAPNNVSSLFDLAKCYWERKQEGDVAKCLEILLRITGELSTGHAPAMEMLCEYYTENKMEAELTALKPRKAFSAWMGRQSAWQIPYSEEVAALLLPFTAARDEDGDGEEQRVTEVKEGDQPVADEANNKPKRLSPLETVPLIAAWPDQKLALQLLGVVILYHYHGSVENKAFECLGALAEGGNADAVEALYTIIRHHQSTCTIKGAVAILARMKEPRIYDMLLRLLPQDISYFPMGIPKALGVLGDERCVPDLLLYANLKQQLPKVKWMLQLNSIESLIYFKHVPEVLEHLKYGYANSERFSDYCLHLLYAATNENEYWEKIQALAAKGALGGGFTLFHLDSHMTPEQAARLQEVIKSNEERKAIHEKELKEKQDRGYDDWMPTEAEAAKFEQTLKFDLAHKYIRVFPEAFYTKFAATVVELELCDNRLSDVPLEFAQMPNLKKLNLQANRLSGVMPANLLLLTSLTEMGFHGNKLTEIPDDIGKLVNLTKLTLSCNEMSGALNESLGDLANLTDLHIDRNKLTSFPQSLCKLEKLTDCGFQGNLLTVFPNFAPGLLAKMDRLFPFDNKFTSDAIPWDSLTHLNLLNISDNQLTYLPWSFAQKWTDGTLCPNKNPWLTEASNAPLTADDVNTTTASSTATRVCSECGGALTTGEGSTSFKAIFPIQSKKGKLYCALEGYFCSPHQEAVDELLTKWRKFAEKS